MIYTKNLSYKDSSKTIHSFHLSAKRSYFDLYTDRKKESEYIWLMEDEKEIGFLSYSINEIPDSDRAFIYIAKIYILEEYRGDDLSSILFEEIEKIEDTQKKLNIDVITLIPANKELEEKLYKKIGFKDLDNIGVLTLYSGIIRTQDPIMYRIKQKAKEEIEEEETALFGVDE